MKTTICLSLLITLSGFSADTAKPAFLSQLEYEVVQEHNRIRSEPAVYAGYLEDRLRYYKGNLYSAPGAIPIRLQEGASAVNEAISFLRKQPPLPAFSIRKGMCQGAKDHVEDQGRSGATGHTGSNKSTPFTRINRYGKWISTAGENISYGFSDAREVILQLVIDDGVRNRGHRTNIFNSAFRVIGVACGPHSRYRHSCVITYAGDYQDAQ